MKYLMLLAEGTSEKIFGDGVTNAPLGGGTISSSFSNLFGFAVNAVILIAALMVITYMLWGALDYITAGGESDKVATARKKMVNAAIGMIIIIAVLVLWYTLVRNVLGLAGGQGSNLEFRLPTIRDLQPSEDDGSRNLPVPGRGQDPGNPKGGGN